MFSGSRLRTIAALGLVSIVGAGASAGVGQAGDPTVSAANDTFVRNLFAGNPAACASMSAGLVSVVIRTTSSSTCREAMAEVAASNRELRETNAKSLLDFTFTLAQVVQEDNLDRLDYADAWVGPHFPVKALAKAMRSRVKHGEIRIVVGSSPRAARGTAENVVVIDALRTTPRVLMLYAESNSGTIWQLAAIPEGKAKRSKSKVKGVAVQQAPLVGPVATLDPSAPTNPMLVLAEVGPNEYFSQSSSGSSDALLIRLPDGTFDKVLGGSSVIPPPTSAPAVDPAPFVGELIAAFASGDGPSLCALIHPAYFATFGFTSSDCTASDSVKATDSTPPELLAPTENNTIVRRLAVDSGGSLPVEEYVLASTDGASYKLTGYFVDVLGTLGNLGS